MYARHRHFILGLVAATGLSLLATELQAATITPGFDPAATLAGAARFRAFGTGGSEHIRVGASDGSGGITSPATGNLTWNFSGAPTKCIQITYASGSLTAKVANDATPCSFTSTLGTATKTGLSLGTLNYLEITIIKNTSTTSIDLGSLVLNGDALGSFTVPNVSTHTRWKVTDIDLTAGFTLTGKLTVQGLSGSGDSNYLQIDVGSVSPSDIDGPKVTSIAVTPVPVLLNGQATVTATIDDTDTGNNNIASASYTLNGGLPNSMTATDSSFNSPVEQVEADFTAIEIGENEICVSGTDSLGNTGDEQCQSFLVTYQFYGFYSPIENGAKNVAKAGQAIPFKWLLTDANDIPISDAASFVGLFSYPVSCSTFTADPADVVEEYAAGKSGLQYLENGYWQFNWKTDKSYANAPNNCRAVYVELDSDATSPVVKVEFKK